MIKKFFIFYFLFLWGIVNQANALEVQCQFEEVYLDGSTQQGFFFFQQGMLRYQYSNPQLYTLIYDLERLYLVQNFNITTYQVIRDDKNIIELLKRVTDDFPNTQNEYVIEDQIFSLETSKTNHFIKRLGIISDRLSLSIYFNDCKTQNDIPRNLFSVRPFVDFKVL